MKKYLYKNIVLLSIIFILLIATLYLGYKYHKDLTPIYETEENTAENVPVDDFVSFGIKNVLPDEGYVTGLSYYPKLSWNNAGGIMKKESQVDLDIIYPNFTGDDTTRKLNQYIFNLISKIIEDDRKLMSVPSADRQNDTISLTSRYRIVGVTNGVVSIEILLTDFTGGSNGSHDTSVTINWDLKSNRLLKNSELFCNKNYIDKLIPLTEESIFKKLYGSDYMKDFVPNENDSWTKKGIANKVDNWDNFLLANNGLVVVFQPYRVASGASGVVRAFIENKDIPNLICLP